MTKSSKNYNLTPFDYRKVLEIVMRYCVSDCSKKKLVEIRPTSSKQDLKVIFSRLRELTFLIENGMHPNLYKINDTIGMVEKAGIKNNYLTAPEISLIRENIISFVSLKKQFSAVADDARNLMRMLKVVRVPFQVKEKIDIVIDEQSNIREDATEKLEDIIKKIRESRGIIEKILESYLNSPDTGKYIQDKHITIKDDRYVIPVKQNFKGRIPGIIHAQSGTGETIFLEPFSITARNNEMKLLQKERDEEIRKILISLTGEIGKHGHELNLIQDILSDMDILLAKYKFMDEYKCSLPLFSDQREIIINGARHPLIRGAAVPIDFEIERSITGVVITGPNTGGKTVSLKTIGLFVLLAQSGFPVPAYEMRSFLFDAVFADIGDEGSIEQSLSTFSGHIKNIKAIIENAGETSLVLIDELGAGTDPVEGGAIGTAILDFLIHRNIPVVVTTHFSIVKMYALSSEKVRVASVQFNPVTCRPTYKLVMGIPGRSNALEIAEQLGLKKEIIDKTSKFIGEKDRSIDAIFKNLGLMEIKLSKKEGEIVREAARVKELKELYDSKLEELREKERFLRIDYRKELSSLLSEYSRRLERSVSKIKKEGASKESIKSARDEIGMIRRDFSEFEKEIEIQDDSVDDEALDKKDFKVGDSVLIDSDFGNKIKGRIKEISENKITVQAGLFKVTVDTGSVVRDRNKAGRTASGWNYEISGPDSTGYECDLRGLRYDEAKNELLKFLDKAVLKNLQTFSVIHGTGTGVLRQMVWETLGNHSFVDHFDHALPEQGGFGCTIVTLKV